ncbi:hypothetical protein Tco_0778314 [Tanacetum coccineum]
MFADLKYVQYLEKEVGELQIDKTKLSKDNDLLLQECVLKYIMCVILCSFDNIDEQTELQFVVKNASTKPVTPHSWPQVRQSAFAKPHPVNALDLSTYSLNPVSKSTLKESVGSNDMVYNYYLEEDKKKAQIEKDKALNTKPNVQKSARLLNTANGSKPKPWNSYQQPRN